MKNDIEKGHITILSNLASKACAVCSMEDQLIDANQFLAERTHKALGFELPFKPDETFVLHRKT